MKKPFCFEHYLIKIVIIIIYNYLIKAQKSGQYYFLQQKYGTSFTEVKKDMERVEKTAATNQAMNGGYYDSFVQVFITTSTTKNYN